MNRNRYVTFGVLLACAIVSGAWFSTTEIAHVLARNVVGGITGYKGALYVKSSQGNPTCATSAAADGTICAENGIESETTLNVAGASTLTGAVTLGGAIDVSGGTITMANDEVLSNATDDFVCIVGAGGTSDEDICFDVDGTNVVAFTSNTGVVNLDFAAVGTTITLANDQTIVSDTNNEIQFGDNSEDVSLGFTADTVTWSTDTGVTSMQFGTMGVLHTARDVTTTYSLTVTDCGKVILVTAGIDGNTITLPSTIEGCVYTFIYTGADDAALVDISPAAADAIHGSCTLAASVVEFNGTDDNDIGLTKATSNTGDTITLVGDGAEGWYVSACAGIWANN